MWPSGTRCLTNCQHSKDRIVTHQCRRDCRQCLDIVQLGLTITLMRLTPMRLTPMRLLWPFLSLTVALAVTTPARADLHITRDHGGYVSEYKAKYERIRARHERVIIDGICNSACTLVFGIVPMNKICVTPRASLGFHQAYYDKAFTFGIKVTSAEGTSDLMSYYPSTVKDWIRRNGGLTTEMKKIKNGPELWKIVDPCPEDY